MFSQALLSRFLFAVSMLGVVFASPLSAQNVKESFTGFAINMNGAANTATVDFTITRWSTDAERTKLLSLIPKENQNPEPLVSALQDMPSVGSIRTPRTLAWDLRYARQFKGEDGGRRIVLVTDRPIGFGEARNNSRSMDNRFTVLEIRLNKNDEGEGKIFGGVQLYIENNELVVENWGTQPTRFNQIRKRN